MAQLNDLLILGKSVLIGDLKVNSKIIQGSPSTDSTILNMNRLQSDLYVAGDGSAPNSPKVPGFYLGKSSSDENRHMDIVSGADYSYIDFNKASVVEDYKTRLIVNVTSGLTELNWNSASNPQLNINGRLVISSTADTEAGSASGALRIGNVSGEHLSLDGNEIMAKSSATAASTLYLNNEGGIVQTSGDGLNVGGCYIRTNTVSSYAGLRIYGNSRGGYEGIHFGYDNKGLTVMNSEPHQGLYNESTGRWILYYKRDNNLISIGNANVKNGFINMGGSVYTEGNIHINNGGHGGIALYNTSPPDDYGIHMSYTSGYGTFGHVSSDWATYFCFDGDVNRGWIFRHANNNVFSINGSGTLSTRVNNPAINFRPDNATYYTTASYQTAGNEALVFAAKNAVTSFIFVNGEDGVTNNASNRWQSLTPGLQIKNNCVAIGKLIASGTNPTYKLEVAGTSYFTGKMQVNAPIFGYNYTNSNNAAAFIWDKPGSNYTGMGANGASDTIYFGACTADGTWIPSYKQKWVFNGAVSADTVAGAVWNDYAEYRDQIETIEPGYCVASTNSGKIYKTTEKFQTCDGIVSDTFGFAIGQTEESKTPLAVAGRVLAYCEGNRYDYNAGDTVCAGPDGKVCKMTRDEIKEYPDRIIGHVSEIPEYEIWGTGNVQVNGRIWIKIK